MSDSLTGTIGNFIGIRVQKAYQGIKDEPGFKQVRMDCLRLQDQIIAAFPPSGERDIFLEFCELANQRESIMHEGIYRRGYRDGMDIFDMICK